MSKTKKLTRARRQARQLESQCQRAEQEGQNLRFELEQVRAIYRQHDEAWKQLCELVVRTLPLEALALAVIFDGCAAIKWRGEFEDRPEVYKIPVISQPPTRPMRATPPLRTCSVMRLEELLVRYREDFARQAMVRLTFNGGQEVRYATPEALRAIPQPALVRIIASDLAEAMSRATEGRQHGYPR